MPDAPKPCDHCGKPYTPKQWFQKYCHARCRLLAFRKRKRSEEQKEE